MNEAKCPHQQLVGCRHNSGGILGRLPVEVLCQIFVFCLPAETHHLRVSTKLAPLALTVICRRWRDVAVSTPVLWCRMCVNVSMDGDWQMAASCYHLWLKRSRDRPLSLAVDCSSNGATKLRRLLRPYMTQISSLQLLSENASNAIGLYLHEFSALRQLKLQWQSGHINDVAIAA